MKQQGTSIHPTAVVGPKTQIGQNVVIGAYAIVENSVTLQDGVQIAEHAVVRGHTTVGEHTKVSSFAVVGALPQDLKYKGEPTELSIGRNNVIREYANISIGTLQGGGITRVGDNNLIMMAVHLAHDVELGNNCIIANAVGLSGHVVVEDAVVIGGHAAIHQFVRIGSHAMVAGCAAVVKDVPPFCMAAGDRARPVGLNTVGLQRAGYGATRMDAIQQMYKYLYRSQLTLDEALERIENSIPAHEDRSCFLDFLRSSQRGICR